MALRVGLLTSGGDCQGLNPAMRGVAKTLYEADENNQIIGFLNGYEGLMTGHSLKMREADFSGILTRGGTILGTSRQPFKQMLDPLEDGRPDGPTKLEAMVETYRGLSLDALVILGGNGTHKTAHLLSQNGINVVTLPKTIDNDLWGTDRTFGFQSAVDIATQVIDGIHSTATSHGRVFIVEIMGHKVGWMCLEAGIAGGADVILLPEIPYEPVALVKALNRRDKKKKRFSIIAIAEGAKTVEEAAMSKAEYEAMRSASRHPSVAYQLAETLDAMMVQEVRCTVPGHFQRGGEPCAFDRVFTTRLGVAAANAVMNGQFGVMMGLRGESIIPVPLDEVAGKLKYVPVDHELIRAARQTGISFGDEN